MVLWLQIVVMLTFIHYSFVYISSPISQNKHVFNITVPEIIYNFYEWSQRLKIILTTVL